MTQTSFYTPINIDSLYTFFLQEWLFLCNQNDITVDTHNFNHELLVSITNPYGAPRRSKLGQTAKKVGKLDF